MSLSAKDWESLARGWIERRRSAQWSEDSKCRKPLSAFRSLGIIGRWRFLRRLDSPNRKPAVGIATKAQYTPQVTDSVGFFKEFFSHFRAIKRLAARTYLKLQKFTGAPLCHRPYPSGVEQPLNIWAKIAGYRAAQRRSRNSPALAAGRSTAGSAGSRSI